MLVTKEGRLEEIRKAITKFNQIYANFISKMYE